jgi:hypothetical protein
MPANRERWAGVLVVLAATAVALASARPYAGAWNDGSRLATVESLVDRGTFTIDDSLFVAVPAVDDARLRTPYRGPALEHGTLDKLLIHEHFYSDKSPVPALLLAAIYQMLQWLFGLQVRLQPALFCYLMNAISSGAAYVVAVACVFQFGKRLSLPLGWRVALCASFGLASVALVYAQYVNNHMLLLSVAAALMLQLACLPAGEAWWRPLVSGCLAGLGYAIDLGAGPPLLVFAGLLVLWQSPSRWAASGFFALGALPWLVVHHAANYMVGGTFGPANAVPEYFLWPGCPFHGATLTGTWHHASPLHFLAYALDMLFGKRGFFGHNLPLLLLLPAAALFLKRWPPQWPLMAFAATWAGCTWLVYAATSHNYSGANLSIRWFVPLLAPAYYGLAILLRQFPRYRTDFLILSGWGFVLMTIAWLHGLWNGHAVPGFWVIQAAALVSWGLYAWRRLKQNRPPRGLILEAHEPKAETVLSAAA